MVHLRSRMFSSSESSSHEVTLEIGHFSRAQPQGGHCFILRALEGRQKVVAQTARGQDPHAALGQRSSQFFSLVAEWQASFFAVFLSPSATKRELRESTRCCPLTPTLSPRTGKGRGLGTRPRTQGSACAPPWATLRRPLQGWHATCSHSLQIWRRIPKSCFTVRSKGS
jgi:hypothetical protein